MLLAEALQAAGGSARVHLIDISSQALEQTEQRLTRLQHFSVVGHQSTYEVGLRRAAAARDGDGPMLVLLLGSNIGNFDTPAALAFLRRIRLRARSPATCSCSAPISSSRSATLQLAYDDPLGVTAAFNKNLLVRINRELGGDFDLAAFDHRAVWNPAEQRIEMHLVSRVAQTVTHRGRRDDRGVRARRADLDRELLQVRARSDRAHGRRHRLRDARSVDRRGRALRADAVHGDLR